MNEDGDTVEGYHILVGGGFGPDAALGRELYPRREGRGCAAHGRAHSARPISRTAPEPEETFLAFARRHDIDALKAMCERRRWNDTRPCRSPIPSLVPETAPFSPEQRAWLNGFFAGLVSLDGERDTRSPRNRSAALMPGAPARRWRRRRSALARPDVAAARPHEARGRPSAAPAHDGRDGAAGLRPVRLQLQGLFGSARLPRRKSG